MDLGSHLKAFTSIAVVKHLAKVTYRRKGLFGRMVLEGQRPSPSSQGSVAAGSTASGTYGSSRLRVQERSRENKLKTAQTFEPLKGETFPGKATSPKPPK